MIRRWNALLWLVLFVASASGLYMVKYRVQAIQTEIAQVDKQLEQERESLRVVEAEWAYLSRPERIQRLATDYLKLQPVQPRQLAGETVTPHTMKQASNAAAMPVAAHTAAVAQPAEGE